jgi:hypothetical protein
LPAVRSGVRVFFIGCPSVGVVVSELIRARCNRL